jgi:hypothetical protein
MKKETESPKEVARGGTLIIVISKKKLFQRVKCRTTLLRKGHADKVIPIEKSLDFDCSDI